MSKNPNWSSWGANGENPLLKHPNSVKPNKDKLVWYNSSYEDQLYGTPQSFSFTDVHATIILPFILPGTGKPPTVSLPGLTLFSISEHRDQYPVVALGRRGIKGFTSGHKTTAGSMGFVLFGESAFAEAIRQYAAWRGVPSDTYFTSPDELPPFDLSLIFHNEKGDAANILIRSMKIVDSSRNISVRDIQLTESFSWMAAKVTTLINAVQELKYTPFNVQKPTQNDNPFMKKKSATTLTTLTTITDSTPPSTSTTSTTTTSTTTTSTTSTTSTSTAPTVTEATEQTTSTAATTGSTTSTDGTSNTFTALAETTAVTTNSTVTSESGITTLPS